MNGMDNPIVFYSAFFVILISAVMAISFRNIFYSLLSAILVFFLAGFFFYILGAEYNAVIQIAVYGVAVPIIIGLGIMFTNLRKRQKEEFSIKKSPMPYYVMFLVGGIFILTLIYLSLTSMIFVPESFNITDNFGQNFSVGILDYSNRIYVRYVWAFEIISVILTIVIVGLTMFKKGIKKCMK